jgi:hypothetical protein
MLLTPATYVPLPHRRMGELLPGQEDEMGPAKYVDKVQYVYDQGSPF